MYEVTCFHCGHTGQLAPDDAQCQSCAQDLRLLIPSDDSVRYFSTRVADFVKRGEPENALGEAERGLAFQPNAELYLQAAILSKKLHKFDRMREHVSAIPLEDSLRLEGEWLLRSHQEKQRSLRETKKADQRLNDTPLEQEGGPSTQHLMPTTRQQPSHPRSFLPSLLLVAMIGIGWFALNAFGVEVGAMTEQLIPNNSLLSEEQIQNGSGSVESGSELPNGAVDNVGEPSEPFTIQAGPDESTSSPSGQSSESPLQPETDSTELDPVQPLEPTPVESAPIKSEPVESAPTEVPPTPEIPDELVSETNESRTTASATPFIPVDPLKAFDLQRILINSGNDALTDLSVEAHIRRRTVILNGTVEMAVQRALIVELIEEVPGIEDVDDTDLRIRLPKSYTVQSGDMLTSIADKLYGDSRRWPELFEYNTDQLLSPDAIRSGMELKIPLDE